MHIVCFEDERVDQLRPVTQARPAYAVTCASLRLIDCLREIDGEVCGAVRSYLETIQTLDYGLDSPSSADLKDGLLLVNARLVPRVCQIDVLRKLARQEQSTAIIDAEDESVLAARIVAADLPASPPEPDANGGQLLVEAWRETARSLPTSDLTLEAFHWPHDVVRWHMQEMPAALEWRLAKGDYQQTSDGVFVRPGVSIGEYAVIDTSEGPILLDENVRVGPFCYLSGPVYAGPHTRVIEHAALKDGVALGHTVKIGGEVEASVIEPYTTSSIMVFWGTVTLAVGSISEPEPATAI